MVVIDDVARKLLCTQTHLKPDTYHYFDLCFYVRHPDFPKRRGLPSELMVEHLDSKDIFPGARLLQLGTTAAL
jgi:hypothetical protein